MPKTLGQVAEKYMADVSDDVVFRVHDDGVLKNLRELSEALKTMPDEIFSFHSNEEKKDFSNWIRDVIGDTKLARDLGKAKTRLQAAKVVERRIIELTRRVR